MRKIFLRLLKKKKFTFKWNYSLCTHNRIFESIYKRSLQPQLLSDRLSLLFLHIREFILILKITRLHGEKRRFVKSRWFLFAETCSFLMILVNLISERHQFSITARLDNTIKLSVITDSRDYCVIIH